MARFSERAVHEVKEAISDGDVRSYSKEESDEPSRGCMRDTRTSIQVDAEGIADRPVVVDAQVVGTSAALSSLHQPLVSDSRLSHRKTAVLVNLVIFLSALGLSGGGKAVPREGGGSSCTAVEAAAAPANVRTSVAATPHKESGLPAQSPLEDCDVVDEEIDSGLYSKEIERYQTLYDGFGLGKSGEKVRDRESAERTGRRPEHVENDSSIRNEDEGDVIVVATVGGTLAGISRSSGKTLWKRGTNLVGGASSERSEPMRPHHRADEGKKYEESSDALFSPLLSTTTTAKKRVSGKDWHTAAVPSTDGYVYLTAGKDGIGSSSSSESGEVTVVANVQDLVSRAPFVDRRGRFYVGARHATAAALDRDTGEVLRILSSSGDLQMGGKNQDKNEDTSDSTRAADQSLNDHNVVWLGRVDHTISVFDARSGETDVRFSTSEVLSVHEMVLDGGALGAIPGMRGANGWNHNSLLMLPGFIAPADEDSDKEESFSNPPSTESPFSPVCLIATPGGNLALRDTNTGEIVWVSNESFETPVAFAVESTTGMSVRVEVIPDVPVPSESKEYLSRELERQLAAMETVTNGGYEEGTVGAEEDETIVGALSNGQLFSMPLGKGRGKPKDSRTNLLPGRPHPHTASSSHMGPSKSRPILSPQEVAVHHPHLHGQHSGVHSPLTTKNKSSCIPSSPNFPACLVGASIKSKGNSESFLDVHSSPDGTAAAVAMMAANFNFDPQYFVEEQHQTRQNKRFRAFLKIMSSWIPPAIALAFVISFELGRRERLKVGSPSITLSEEHLSKDDRVPSEFDPKKSAAALTSNTKMGKVTDGSIEHEGFIQITDEVLGYGGHGTVVYRGKLDGRNVAVKRMLKTYHASADREISLLIESDGHSNVVRYFLKEVRGDFVYLALELCEMSLNDLIMVLGKRQLLKHWVRKNGKEDNSCEENKKISPATKSLLLQIASGVRHIHSLRIVHRDLKPQNILLAQCSHCEMEDKVVGVANTSSEEELIFASFNQNNYVPKISDMGLGKQLEGQSSFGLSTLESASARLRCSAGASSVVGIGPGSVGWQAPEVMAQRLSPESMVQEYSDVGSGCMAEASPMEFSLNTRTSRSVDIFSLGCIFYCTIIPGSHPYGEWYEREANIMKNQPSTAVLNEVSADAADLVSSMICRDPKGRPTAAQVCKHPFFWEPAKRLAFLCELSDRLEVPLAASIGCEVDSAPDKAILDPFIVEKHAADVLGTAWDRKLDQDLLSNVSRFRSYDPSSVRDFLRLLRNKHHHYDELPPKVKDRIGTNPDGLVSYFEDRFPRLVMHCYHVCHDHLPENDHLALKYGIPVKKGKGNMKYSNKKVSEKGGSVIRVETKAYQSPGSANSGKPNSHKLAVLEKSVSNTENESQLANTNSKLFSNLLNNLDPPPLALTEDSLLLNGKFRSKENDSMETTCLESNTTISHSSSQLFGSCDILTGQAQPEQTPGNSASEIVVWEGSNTAKSFNCRGWMRSDGEWVRRTDTTLRKRDSNVTRCATDPKFRTRLCNHWDTSKGTFCPMRKKGKCVFAHGPVELRVKEAKKTRWGTLVDKNGNNSNPNNSGGEDTYGAARTIETMRKEEGKWSNNPGGTPVRGKRRGRQGTGKKK